MATLAPTRRIPSTSRAKALLLPLGAIFGGLVIGLLGVLFVATQFLGYGVLAVRSDSMQPALSRGDLIFTRPQLAEDVDVGEIAVFTQGEEIEVLIAHRVVGVIDGTINITNETTGEVSQQKVRHLQTQGDANVAPDAQLVNPGQLAGTVWFSVPAIGGWIVDWHVQKLLVLLASLSVAGWVFYEVFNFLQRRKGSADADWSVDTPIPDVTEAKR